MKNTKLVSIILSVIMCFGILGGAFSASAADDYVKVHLYSNQGSASSANVYGSYKCYWGSNSASSKHSVYFIARYKYRGTWHTDSNKTSLVQPGKEITRSNEVETTHFSDERYWFLRLNPEGANKTGCDAEGYMRNK